jgi:hypothetical protein
VTLPRSGSPSVTGFGPLVRVARGGFASVYRAEDEHIGRVVAIKVLEHLDAGDPRSRDRFLRETRAMGRLSGLSHIVDIYQATFTADGQPCIVMPFFAGGSLEDRLAAAGPLSAGSALAVGVTIGRAVDAAHRRGISHRDLKPGNILIDERGDVALADFGIAVVEDAAASAQTRTALSPEHAAPERLVLPADGPVPEPWGDQFSLASTLHMLLTGRPPFGLVAELGLHEVLRRIVELPAPSTGRDDVPPELEAVLARGLAKQPDARFPSASAFADALVATGVAPADPPVPMGSVIARAAPAVPVGADAGSAPTAAAPARPSMTPRSPGPVPYHHVSPGPAPTPAPAAPFGPPPAADAPGPLPAGGAPWSTPRMAPSPPPVLSPGMEPVARRWPGPDGSPPSPPLPPADPFDRSGAAVPPPIPAPGRGGPDQPPAPSGPTVAPPPAYGPPAAPAGAPGPSGPTVAPPGYGPPAAPAGAPAPSGPTVAPRPAYGPPAAPAQPAGGPAGPRAPAHVAEAGTIVPEHRRGPVPAGAGPAEGEAPPLSRTRRALLIGTAAWVVVAAFVALGIVLRSAPAPPPETQTGPDPSGVAVPPGTTPPAGNPRDRPAVNGITAVPDAGLAVSWTDEAGGGTRDYAYQVFVDDQATAPASVDRQPDGAPRHLQVIGTVRRNGAQEKVDVTAHTYCVVIRRLVAQGSVDSPSACLHRQAAPVPATAAPRTR